MPCASFGVAVGVSRSQRRRSFFARLSCQFIIVETKPCSAVEGATAARAPFTRLRQPVVEIHQAGDTVEQVARFACGHAATELMLSYAYVTPPIIQISECVHSAR